MSDPMTDPKSIVVIHGVGDHKEDETARTFSRALAQARGSKVPWSPPSLVTRIGDVHTEVTSDPARVGAGGSTVEAFPFSAYRIEVPWPGPRWAIPLYEFYWSNLSRQGLGLIGEAAKVWRFLVGTPRIGYHALTVPALGPLSGFLLGSARVFYGLTWAVVAVRLVAGLALILTLGLFKMDAWYLRYYDTVLGADLAISALLLAFTASWWLLLLPVVRGAERSTSRPPEEEPRRSGWLSRLRSLAREAPRWGLAWDNVPLFRSVATAAMALAVTVLFCQAVPLSILEVTQLDQQFRTMEPWRYLVEPSGSFKGTLPSHFYARNTAPGCMPYLMYGFIVFWAVFVTGVQYGLGTLLIRYPAAPDAAAAALPNPRRNVAVTRMRRVVAETEVFWSFLTVLVVAVAPALFWADLIHILKHETGLYLYDPKASTPWDAFAKALNYAWIHFVVYLFIFLVWGLMTWPTLRRAVAPALELAFDVGAYFPPVLGHAGRGAVVDLALGRGSTGGPQALESRLSARLRAVIRYAYDQDPGPVAVVGHSLGSVIAMAALKEPVHGSDGRAVEVELVTLGSPLRLLRERFPHLYRDERWSDWKFPGVRRWLNLYRAADPIGRDLHLPGVEDVNLKNGGHAFYFEDRDVAVFLVNWLYPGQSEAATPGVGARPVPGPDGP